MDNSITMLSTNTQTLQVTHQPQRNISPIKSNDESQQKPCNQDIMKRKKQGEPLNIGEEKLIEMIEKANKTLLMPPTELQYSVHEKTNQISVKIINKENQEVIKEIPSEKVLDMVARMCELVGLFVDEEV